MIDLITRLIKKMLAFADEMFSFFMKQSMKVIKTVQILE